MKPRCSGFTVLEVLIALTIMAMIAAALAGTTSLGSRVWRQASFYPNENVQMLLRSRLRYWLETAKPSARSIGHRQQFLGTKDRLSFLTTAYIPGGVRGAEARITVLLTEENGGNKLVRLNIDWLDSDGGVLANDARTLIGQVNEGSFRYFRQVNGASGGWQDHWEEPRRLPDLISIEAESRVIVWPPLIVSPKLE